MSLKLAQSAGVCCLIIGVSGITGSMECGTGFIQSAAALAVGIVLMCLSDMMGSIKEDEGKPDVR